MAKPHIFFDNRLADATPVASSTAAGGGYAAANLGDWRAYTCWKPSALPATVTVDCGAPVAADYALVHGHDLFSKGCTVEVRASTDNFAASNVLLATLTPTSDKPLAALFNTATYRYWRLVVDGADEPAIAIAAIGQRMELPTWFPQPFDPLGRKVVGQTNRNEQGHALGKAIKFQSWKEKVKLERVPWSWAHDTFAPAFDAHLMSTPFALAWELDIFPSDIKLINPIESYETPHYSGSTCDVTFDVEAVVT